LDNYGNPPEVNIFDKMETLQGKIYWTIMETLQG
jgi:hypothetical protein